MLYDVTVRLNQFAVSVSAEVKFKPLQTLSPDQCLTLHHRKPLRFCHLYLCTETVQKWHLKRSFASFFCFSPRETRAVEDPNLTFFCPPSPESWEHSEEGPPCGRPAGDCSVWWTPASIVGRDALVHSDSLSPNKLSYYCSDSDSHHLSRPVTFVFPLNLISVVCFLSFSVLCFPSQTGVERTSDMTPRHPETFPLIYVTSPNLVNFYLSIYISTTSVN